VLVDIFCLLVSVHILLCTLHSSVKTFVLCFFVMLHFTWQFVENFVNKLYGMH